MKTFVITNPELGWDCVMGVYQAKSEKALIKYLKANDDYDKTDIITEVEMIKI